MEQVSIDPSMAKAGVGRNLGALHKAYENISISLDKYSLKMSYCTKTVLTSNTI